MKASNIVTWLLIIWAARKVAQAAGPTDCNYSGAAMEIPDWLHSLTGQIVVNTESGGVRTIH
jgi:hypothetical protein